MLYLLLYITWEINKDVLTNNVNHRVLVTASIATRLRCPCSFDLTEDQWPDTRVHNSCLRQLFCYQLICPPITNIFSHLGSQMAWVEGSSGHWLERFSFVWPIRRSSSIYYPREGKFADSFEVAHNFDRMLWPRGLYLSFAVGSVLCEQICFAHLVPRQSAWDWIALFSLLSVNTHSLCLPTMTYVQPRQFW